MARSSELKVHAEMEVVVRMANPELQQLLDLLFRRYPKHEWATFARFGWRVSSRALVLTLAGLEEQVEGDLDETVPNVAFQESYSLRTALHAERHSLGVGVCHSHPQECSPRASSIDDDMDRYYADYFSSFAPTRPFASLIASKVGKELALSGRVHYQGRWLTVTHFATERIPTRTWVLGRPPREAFGPRRRVSRLAAAFGYEAEDRLRRSCVAVIGAGGTGSAAIEVLARAGVGNLVIVDPDTLDESNLERVHGSEPSHAKEGTPKVLVALEHVRRIDPTCTVTAIRGALPQDGVVNAVVRADAALGCTDQQHSRLALSDLAFRYLVPSIDCGVSLEGEDGRISGQVIQLVRFLAADACVLCRRMTDPQRVLLELVPQEERQRRIRAAADAAGRGEDPAAYWIGSPQLNTVGYLTTAAGAIAAGYVIGWLTGRFDPPFSKAQINLAGKFLDVTDVDHEARAGCTCRRARGWADQGAADTLITAPAHWPADVTLSEGSEITNQ